MGSWLFRIRLHSTTYSNAHLQWWFIQQNVYIHVYVYMYIYIYVYYKYIYYILSIHIYIYTYTINIYIYVYYKYIYIYMYRHHYTSISWLQWFDLFSRIYWDSRCPGRLVAVNFLVADSLMVAVQSWGSTYSYLFIWVRAEFEKLGRTFSGKGL